MAFKGCTNLTKVLFEGTISLDNFGYSHSYRPGIEQQSFPGNFKDKFYEDNSTNGKPGLYLTTKPVNENSKWGLFNITDSTYSNSSNTASFYLKYNGEFVYYTGYTMDYLGTWTFSGDTLYTPLGSFTVIEQGNIYSPVQGTWHLAR